MNLFHILSDHYIYTKEKKGKIQSIALILSTLLVRYIEIKITSIKPSITLIEH